MPEQAVDTPVESNAIAGRIQAALRHARMNQSEFARRAGISSGFLSDVTRGQKRPGADLLIQMRRELGVSIDWLLTGEGAMFGAAGIRQELLRAIRVQIAVARAAVIDEDPMAKELVRLVQDGQLDGITDDARYSPLLDRVALTDEIQDLSVQLYNGCLYVSDPEVQRKEYRCRCAGAL